jgi:hypothetical protein
MSNKGVQYMSRGQLPSTVKSLGINFDTEAEFSGCWLCGAVYQSPQDRAYKTLLDANVPVESLVQLKQNADRLRDEWRTKHSQQHSDNQHEALALSPDLCTIEAGIRLAPLGVFPLEGSVDLMQALAESARIPEGRIDG